jgi:hypothetical protein
MTYRQGPSVYVLPVYRHFCYAKTEATNFAAYKGKFGWPIIALSLSTASMVVGKARRSRGLAEWLTAQGHDVLFGA